MGHLEHLDRRQAQRQQHRRLGIGAEQHVCLAVGDEADDGTKVRVLARHAGTVGPSTRTRSLPIAYSRPGRAVTIGARRSIASATAARSSGTDDASRGSSTAWTRVLSQDVCRPTDVIPLRMCQHEQRQLADTESPQLFGHVRLWWALVDEHRAVQHLQQGGVSLADVQERDAQPCGARCQGRAPRASRARRGCDSREDRHGSRRRATTIAAATSSRRRAQ